MLVIGIDPGTATTGYGFVREQEDGSLEVVDFGVIITSAQTAMSQRLQEIYVGLSELLVLHRPVSGAVEKLLPLKYTPRNLPTSLDRLSDLSVPFILMIAWMNINRA